MCILWAMSALTIATVGKWEVGLRLCSVLGSARQFPSRSVSHLDGLAASFLLFLGRRQASPHVLAGSTAVGSASLYPPFRRLAAARRRYRCRSTLPCRLTTQAFLSPTSSKASLLSPPVPPGIQVAQYLLLGPTDRLLLADQILVCFSPSPRP